jgi:hypothetical protein
MRWWVEPSDEALDSLRKIPHTRDDARQIRDHLSNLAAQARPGDGLMVMDGHELRYSAVGRFRIVFELRPSSSQPPGSLIVTNIVAFSK